MEGSNDNGNDEVDDDDDDDDDDTAVHIRLLVFFYYDSRDRRHTIVIDDLVHEKRKFHQYIYNSNMNKVIGLYDELKNHHICNFI